MRTSTSAAARIVAVLLAGTLAACSSSSRKFSASSEASADWDAAVDRSIQDPARAARVKSLGQELVALQRTMAVEFSALNERAVALNASYQATAEDATKLSRDYHEHRRAAFARYRDLVFALRSEVSKKEWKALTE